MTDLLKMIEQWEADAKYMLAKPCSPEDHILEQYGDYRDERILKLSKALKIAIEELKSTASKDCGLVSVLEANAESALQEIEAVMNETN